MNRVAAAIAAAAVAVAGYGAIHHTPSGSAGSVVTPVVNAAEAGLGKITTTLGHGRPYSEDAWSRAFLKAAGYKRTAQNVCAIDAWQHTEGTGASLKNPLDDTLALPGSHTVNGDGVRWYPNWADGIKAAVHTLRYHPLIEAALAAGDNAQAVADAVIKPSVTGHYWGTQPFQPACPRGP